MMLSFGLIAADKPSQSLACGPVHLDQIPAPIRRLGRPLLPLIRFGLRLRVYAARVALRLVGGGELRERLLLRLLGLHYRTLFLRQWRWADEPPHFFDHRIGSFGFATGNEHGFSYIRGYFASELVRDGDRVLDIGCGDGFFARRFFAARGASVDAIDIEPSSIDHASRHNAAPGIRYRLQDAVNEPFPADEYDIVVWDGALGHFPPDTTERMLEKIKATLAADGAFVGSESLGIEGADHLQFFHSLEELGELFARHFPHVMVREFEYRLPGGSLRREAFWRCATEPARLERAAWHTHVST
jgi:SAM-dependent methyltransferase